MDICDNQVSVGAGFELWGYPGAGKSTQARLLASRTDLNSVEIPSMARCLLTHSKLASATLAHPAVLQGFRMSFTHANTAFSRLSSLAVRQRATLSNAPGTIIEEGLTHEIWRLLFNCPEHLRSSFWRHFVPFAGPNIIVLDVEPAESLSRILTKRAPGPVNRELARADVRGAIWARAVDAYDAVLAAIVDEGTISVSVISVGNLSAGEVSDEIASIVQGARSGRSFAARQQ
jgi:broad-specificity NMP kinase